MYGIYDWVPSVGLQCAQECVTLAFPGHPVSLSIYLWTLPTPYNGTGETEGETPKTDNHPPGPVDGVISPYL